MSVATVTAVIPSAAYGRSVESAEGVVCGTVGLQRPRRKPSAGWTGAAKAGFAVTAANVANMRLAEPLVADRWNAESPDVSRAP